MLPDEIVDQLKNEYPCRETQIQHLAALYSRTLPSPPLLNIHGLTATGKSSIIRSYFALASLPHAIIYSKECITGRHLLERTVSSCLDALDEFYDEKADRRPYARTENLSALCVNLARMLEGRGRFTLVLDGIDKQREAPPTLLASLARLGEVIPNLSLILISTLALPINALHHFSLPTLHFPPYPRNSLIEILNQKPPKIFLTPPSSEFYSDYTPDLAAEDDQWLWNRFLSAVWDSLAKHSARDLISYRNTALRLWRPFVAPIISGQFGTRDFIRLMVNRRHLFQLEDPVLDRIIATSEVPMIDASNPDVVATTTPTAKKAPRTLAHDLPYYTTHLLIAAYLASYNPARTDATYFMKHTDKLKRKGKGKRGGTSTSTPSLPTHTTTSRSKHRKIPRHLLTPSPFPLDRLLAIFRALLDGPVPQTSDLLTQVATLTSMRLLVRAGAGAGDVLEPGTRWRVNFGWEYVRSLGRGVGVEVGEWLLGGG